MKKKITALFLIIVLIVTSASCNKGKAESPTSVVDLEDTITTTTAIAPTTTSTVTSTVTPIIAPAADPTIAPAATTNVTAVPAATPSKDPTDAPVVTPTTIPTAAPTSLKTKEFIPNIGDTVPVPNGSFETLALNGKWLPWECRNKGATANYRTSIDTTTAYHGKNSLKIEGLGTGSRRFECVSIDNELFSTNVIYEMSAWVKTDFSIEPGSTWIGFEYYYYYPNTFGEWHSDLDVYSSPSAINISTPGQWVQFTRRFQVPEGDGSRMLLSLVLQNDIKGTVWFDDIRITVVGGPEAYTLDTDKVFPYSDEAGINVYVDLNPFYTNGPEAQATVDFKLYDSAMNTIVYESNNNNLIDNRTHIFIPITELAVLKRKYTLVSTIKDSIGTQVKEMRQNLHKFNRPLLMDIDGDINYGKVFPDMRDIKFNINVFYQILKPDGDQARLQMMADAGATVIFSFDYLEERTDIWDSLEATDLKIMYNLRYPSVGGAGHPDMIERTKTIVEMHKENPAIFAWFVDDEPLGGAITGSASMEQAKQWLEDAYVAIRTIDDIHPVYLVDFNHQNEVRKYCDIFSYDMYPRSDNTTAISNTIIKDLAVNNSRPVYNIACTYVFAFEGSNVPPTEGSIRNSVYRLYEAGGRGNGYFLIEGAFVDENYKFVANLYDTHLWWPFVIINTEEVPLLYDLYISGKSKILGESDIIPNGENGFENGLMWRNWISSNGEVYVLAHNKGRNTHRVTIPVKINENITAARYTAIPVGLTKGDNISGRGNLVLSLGREEIALYRIVYD